MYYVFFDVLFSCYEHQINSLILMSESEVVIYGNNHKYCHTRVFLEIQPSLERSEISNQLFFLLLTSTGIPDIVPYLA